MVENNQNLLAEYSAIRQSMSELTAIYTDAPIGMAVIGTDFRFRRINAKLAHINGASIDAHIGCTIREVVPKLADLGENLVRKVARTGEPILNLELEGETAAEPGVLRNFVEHWSPIRGPGGEVVAVNVVVEEVTAHKRAEQALRASEARLREVLESINDAFVVLDHGFRVTQMNRHAIRLDGRAAREIIGLTHWEAWPMSVGTAVETTYRRVMAERVPLTLEHRYVDATHDIWLDISAYPTSEGIALFYRDITGRKLAEERSQLLMREVNHRSKNLLAVVQSIAHQTARGADPETFAARFAERLAGLASCQDLLVRSQWKGVDLRALITAQLAHYQHLIGTRILLDGGPLRVGANATQSLGMALHELATNAAKYGALSCDAGKVTIRWSLSPSADEIAIDWSESGGPPVTAPDHAGLGSQIITRLLERSLGGAVKLRYDGGGVAWAARLPASTVLEAGSDLTAVPGSSEL